VDILFVILLGGIFGSFANVCIYRLPIEKNVVFGRSFCPECKKKIAWFDNIPIISFIILKAKCRNCEFKISLNYFIVESLSILFFCVIFILFGISLTTLLLWLLYLSFVIIFFIDLKHFIIPNEITFPLMALGFVKSFDPNINSIFPNYLNSLIGGLIGYLIIYLIIFFYKYVRKKEGMGLGDAKLFAVIGFWFGWISIPFIIFLSSIIALISISPNLINKSKNISSEIPFGPYIIIATLVFVIFKNDLLNIVL
tara:strand:+ start:1852 stop:2613 length:762 start_codon:yes stop_codon:yes gene_type:complete